MKNNGEELIIQPPKPTWQEGQESKVPEQKPVAIVTADELEEKYQEFLNSNEIAKRIEEQGLELHGYEYLIHVFVPDFADKSNISFGLKDMYKRYTGIGKVVARKPKDTVSPQANYPDYNVGDLVFLGDDLMNRTINPKWEQWYNSAGNNQILRGEEPIQYLYKIHAWILQGKLYMLNRGTCILESDGLDVNAGNLGSIKEPMVFRLDVGHIVGRIKNPWK